MQRVRAVLCALAAIPFAAAIAQQLPPVNYANGVPQCPSDTDLRNIDTRLSARVIPPQNEVALRMERDKAARCRMIGATYSDNDWKRMKAVTRGED